MVSILILSRVCSKRNVFEGLLAVEDRLPGAGRSTSRLFFLLNIILKLRFVCIQPITKTLKCFFIMYCKKIVSYFGYSPTIINFQRLTHVRRDFSRFSRRLNKGTLDYASRFFLIWWLSVLRLRSYKRSNKNKHRVSRQTAFAIVSEYFLQSYSELWLKSEALIHSTRMLRFLSREEMVS